MANWRQLLSGTLAALALATVGQAQVPQVDSNQERQRQEEVSGLSRAKARSLEVTVGKQNAVRAELHREPILRWSNPTIGSIYGDVFVWTAEGRPVALASIYRWYHPHRTATVELASVSEGPVAAKEGEVLRWDCESSGISLDSVPGAPPPAKSREGRLVQMRELAGGFSARLEDVRDGEQVTRELRLLRQPVFRYESPENGVLEGAIFAFVEGTDPEAWLLLEARVAKDEDKLAWRFATARMNIDELVVSYRTSQVKQWRNVRDNWMDRRANYTLFNFDPALVHAGESSPAPRSLP